MVSKGISFAKAAVVVTLPKTLPRLVYQEKGKSYLK